MQLYTKTTLDKGTGVFDHLMRGQTTMRSYHKDMPAAVAIGVISAAITAGLNEDQVVSMIQRGFDAKTSDLMLRLLDMYGGQDERLHLWHPEQDGRLKLCSDLSYGIRPDWVALPHAPIYACEIGSDFL